MLAYSAAAERRYFLDEFESVDVVSEYENSVDEWCDQLRQTLDDVPAGCELSIVRNRDIKRYWKEQHNESTTCLVIIYLGKKGLTQYYRSIIRATSTPILVVSERSWRWPVNIVAAVDPFHQGDQASHRDVRIINESNRLARTLSASVTIFHSCYVPAYLLSYKKNITEIQQQNVRDFMDETGSSSCSLAMLTGEPSKRLREYVSENKTDILCIGSTARGLFDMKHLGSTVEDILANPPCDLLLIGS